MACSKYALANTGSTAVNFNYRRCDDAMWQYQVPLDPNETKNIWLINGTYSIAPIFQTNVSLIDYGPFPLTPTPTGTPAATPTPTGTPAATPTPTPTPTPIVYDFDVTADWGSLMVTDQTTFIAWLTESGALTVNITAFSLIAGRLQASMSVTGSVNMGLSNNGVTLVNKIGGFTNLEFLDLSSNNITTFNPLTPLPSTLTSLNLSDNQIVTFNPSIALPTSLELLNLNSNQIVTFNPSIALPTSLTDLSLVSNQIVTFNPSIALPTSLNGLYLNSNQIVTFNPSIALPTSLSVLNLDVNRIVTFNPSLPLPTSLFSLALRNNLMTTAGYTGSETWANAQTSFTSTCEVYFVGNVNSVAGTNLATILGTKNCNVIA